MKILAFADLHLGAGAGYGRTPGDRLHDQEVVLDQIFALADEHQVDLVLFAGDLFEGPGVTPEHLDAFVRPFQRIQGRIPFVSIVGNGKHDAAMRAVNGVQILSHIPGITVSSTPQLVDVAGATIATLPWVHPGRLVAAHDGDVDRDEVNREAAGLLVATARGLRAQIPDDRPAILALHGSVSGASLPTGLSVDELQEPVLDWDALDALGFDAIVAGHIHRAQLLSRDGDASRGFYTGSPLPLNFGEADGEHGVYLLTIDPEIALVAAEFLPIESRPFVRLDYDLTGGGIDSNDLGIYLDGDLEGAVVRLRYRATQEQQRRIDVAELRATVLAAGAHVVKIESDIVREDRTRVDGVNEDLAPLDAYDLYVTANDLDPELALRARVRLAEHLETVSA